MPGSCRTKLPPPPLPLELVSSAEGEATCAPLGFWGGVGILPEGGSGGPSGFGIRTESFSQGRCCGCLQIPFLQFFQEEIYNVGGGRVVPSPGLGLSSVL